MKYSKKTRERARELYLTGEITAVAEIARRLKVKPHTVGSWKRQEDWDALRLKIDRRAATCGQHHITVSRGDCTGGDIVQHGLAGAAAHGHVGRHDPADTQACLPCAGKTAPDTQQSIGQRCGKACGKHGPVAGALAESPPERPAIDKSASADLAAQQPVGHQRIGGPRAGMLV